MKNINIDMKSIMSMPVLIAWLSIFIWFLIATDPTNIYLERLSQVWMALVFGKWVMFATQSDPASFVKKEIKTDAEDLLKWVLRK